MSTTSPGHDRIDDPPPVAPVATTIKGPTDTVAERPSTVGASPVRRGAGLFRAFWRWHFYASMLVVPVMFLLAVTGLVILYRGVLDPVQHPGVLTVDVPAYGAARPLSAQEAAVRAVHPDARITAVQQGGGDRATFFTVELSGGRTRNVYVNPYTARVTGAVDPEDQWSNIANEIQGTSSTGRSPRSPWATTPCRPAG